MMLPNLPSRWLSPADDPQSAYTRFRLATWAGNEAYSDGAHLRALSHFEDALKLARRLFQRAADGEGCPERATSALFVARHNVARNLTRLGRLEEATAHLEATCRTLCDWRAAPHAPAKLSQTCDDLLPSAMETCIAQLERCEDGADRILALHRRAARQI